MKILVIKNRALGDAILTLGAIQYLSALMPEAKLLMLFLGGLIRSFRM